MPTTTLPGGTFSVAETHGRATRPGNQLRLHSPDAGWRSLYAATFREAPFSAREQGLGHPSLIYHLSHPTSVSRRVDGAQPERGLIGPRRFCLTPGDAATEWQHRGHPEILQVYLRRSIYEAAVERMYGDPGAGLRPRFAAVDPLLEQVALAILAALEDGTADDGLYVDTLAQMIAVHLARHHTSRSRLRQANAPDALTSARVTRLLDYIEAHLDGDLSLERLAAEVGISPLYLPRLFKTALGVPPHRYVLARRIERAKALLRQSDVPVAEVALAAGFSSQSHLSHWFLRRVGVSPAAYRRT